MAQTYQQLQKKIQQLQQQAESMRAQEVAGVIDRIKVAIAHYGLTASQLGLDTRAGGGRSSRGAAPARSRIAFSDGQGNDWSGRGPRPKWLREAIAAGRSIEDFRVAVAGFDTDAAAPRAASAGRRRTLRKRAPSKHLYRDDAGHSWTGRGPKPGWLKAQLEAGKTLQDFAQ